MDRRMLAASVAAAALGLAIAAPAHAADKKMSGMEKCYGINANAKNDCAAGAHSCAGQATKARDPNSFVYLPAGAGAMRSGGMLSATCGAARGGGAHVSRAGAADPPARGDRPALSAPSCDARGAAGCRLA